MRVVAGELGGRRLTAPKGSRVRPTSDRLRETLFSILGEVEGLDVLDLFAGTGALAVEALSRGARRASLVDLDPEAARRNIEALGLEQRARVVRSDALRFLRSDRAIYGLICCDPPYKLADRLEADLDKLIPARLAPHGRLFTESSRRRPLELPSLRLARERRQGESLLRIWEGR